MVFLAGDVEGEHGLARRHAEDAGLVAPARLTRRQDEQVTELESKQVSSRTPCGHTNYFLMVVVVFLGSEPPKFHAYVFTD